MCKFPVAVSKLHKQVFVRTFHASSCVTRACSRKIFISYRVPTTKCPYRKPHQNETPSVIMLGSINTLIWNKSTRSNPTSMTEIFGKKTVHRKHGLVQRQLNKSCMTGKITEQTPSLGLTSVAMQTQQKQFELCAHHVVKTAVESCDKSSDNIATFETIIAGHANTQQRQQCKAAP